MPSSEVALEIIAFLVQYHAPYTERVRSVCDKLWLIVERRKKLTPGEVTQMMAMVTLSLESQMIGYADRARAVRLLVATVGEDKARKHLEAHWHLSLSTAHIRAENIPHLVDLMQQKALPIFIRNEIYEILHNLIPQFDKVAVEGAVVESL